MGVEFSRTTQDDLEELIANLREADRLEVVASTGDARRAVLESAEVSVWTVTLRIDGALACVFGVAPLVGLIGSMAAPWMLGTPVIDANPRVLLEHSPRLCGVMLCQYPHLINHVDARNKRSVRWLKWLGFTIHPALPYGEAQLPFHLFEMRA